MEVAWRVGPSERQLLWRQARAAAGAGSAVSSESDASPIRRYAGRKAEGVQ